MLTAQKEKDYIQKFSEETITNIKKEAEKRIRTVELTKKKKVADSYANDSATTPKNPKQEILTERYSYSNQRLESTPENEKYKKPDYGKEFHSEFKPKLEKKLDFSFTEAEENIAVEKAPIKPKELPKVSFQMQQLP